MTPAFDIFIDKDVVRRILASHYRPGHDSGPSWLTFIGHMKDSLWSLDLFRCESATLRTYWALVVVDQYTAESLGSASMPEPSTVSHSAGCSTAPFDGNRGCPSTSAPTMIPFRFAQWQSNLRILEVTEIKTVPDIPLSHPFVERLIGTIRREYLDRTSFWTTADLENKLLDFQTYFNEYRAHTGGKDERRNKTRAGRDQSPTSIANGWQCHCRGLYHTPVAA
jgi:putative transposase